MLVLVHFDDGVKALLQRFAVCCEADDREYYPRTLVLRALAANLEELGCVPSVDIVAGS
jgi:hypothetical protein